MNVLLVTHDSTLTEQLHERFSKRFGRELKLQTAEGALYALTMLERDTPDLIVSSKHLSDMSGLDFHEIVRDDTSAKDVAFILLDPSASAVTPSNLSRFLEEHAHPADILRAAFELLLANGRVHDTRRAPRDRLHATARHGDAKVSGTLEIFTLFDLVVSLTQRENSGSLYVIFGSGEAVMFLEKGRFVHAEFDEMVGEEAVVRIFAEADIYKNAEFHFEPNDTPLSSDSTTIHTSVQALLLKVAVALDHERETVLQPAGG